jgi:hypothetical protein
MFDFSKLTVNSVVDSKLSVSQIQQNIKDIALNELFGDNTDNLIQIDTHKFVMPIDYNGKIHYVELDFVAKKDDFDAENAEHLYQVKLQKTLEKEIEQESKKKKTE